MIFTNDEEAVKWLKQARFDGRTEGVWLGEDRSDVLGYNMYMEPTQAARGLALFDLIKDEELRDLDVEEQGYPDLTRWGCFK